MAFAPTSLTISQLQLLRVAFRPHAPIEEPDNFIGREGERARVTEALLEPGLQVVVFGERGAGKTSLTNVATAVDDIDRIQVFCEINSTFSHICRDILRSYDTLYPGVIRYDAQTDKLEIAGVSVNQNDITGNILLRAFKKDKPICIILDEIDRIQDKSVVAQLAELAKNISTYSTFITLVFIGVSVTADELLSGHVSNFRNLRQVHLGRMTRQELEDIIKRGENVLSINFSDEATESILQLCDSFPYYLHLLATNSARSTLARNGDKVLMEDLINGISLAASDADQSLREVYNHAILSVKHSGIYRRVIWAMAALSGTSHAVSEIAAAANIIAVEESDEPVSVQAYGAALVNLKSAEKQNILISRTTGFTSFSNPLMKGFVRLIRAQ